MSDERLEPGLDGMADEAAVQKSIAISLKRIADALVAKRIEDIAAWGDLMK